MSEVRIPTEPKYIRTPSEPNYTMRWVCFIAWETLMYFTIAENWAEMAYGAVGYFTAIFLWKFVTGTLDHTLRTVTRISEDEKRRMQVEDQVRRGQDVTEAYSASQGEAWAGAKYDPTAPTYQQWDTIIDDVHYRRR